MTSTGESVALLRQLARELASADVATLPPRDAEALHRELRAATDQLQSVAARLLARVEDGGRWVGAARTFPEWVARQTRSSVGAARGQAQLGRALTDALPGTAGAVARGEITLEHADVMARFAATSDARRDALAADGGRAEAALLAKARLMRADRFRTEAKRWAAAVDAQAHEREHAAARAKEHLSLLRPTDGVAISGFLTVERGDLLATALRAVTGVPSADDDRPSEQRHADALVGLARLVLDKGLAGGGGQVRPHITVHVAWETFLGLAGRAGVADEVPAELADGEPIPRSVLERIACDSEIARVVFGPTGELLDVGRSQRTFTGAQRHAVVARDRTCAYPDCDRPPQLGEVHHVAWWVRDSGPTAVKNGVLLCWYHHDVVHRENLAITRRRGRWEFRRRDGSRMGPPAAGEDGPAPAGGAPPGGRARARGATTGDADGRAAPPDGQETLRIAG
ncbi:HNH endonuclease signature motif containing protein [Actinotalea fermentans]|uniref:DUF222 domain-containing protein n=1 Tax=Actinotalea fermentans TaxID=43671 RepID=A0A511YZY9_9CELL|nr:HNH endonuclease signature motif containing protein [Actinotalea fermentans]GEN80749.1 hypothetical protein AFE02nite_24830 [Actinotalea fermentans]